MTQFIYRDSNDGRGGGAEPWTGSLPETRNTVYCTLSPLLMLLTPQETESRLSHIIDEYFSTKSSVAQI
jgi:hypothetical protein